MSENCENCELDQKVFENCELVSKNVVNCEFRPPFPPPVYMVHASWTKLKSDRDWRVNGNIILIF